MMRIAVLGAAGQIGSRVIDRARLMGLDAVGVARQAALPASGATRYADVKDPDVLAAAVSDCDVVVAALGLPYDIAAWTTEWPALTRSVLQAVESVGNRLVWLDNCYSSGAASGPIDEKAPAAPCSALGRARASGQKLIAEAVARGMPVTEARAADFVGPGIENTVLPWRTLVRLGGSGHRPVRLPWIGDPRTAHSYASAEEVVAGLLALATDDALARTGGIWHLPVFTPCSGLELCADLGEALKRQVLPAPLPSALVQLAGLVSPRARAATDMAYLTAQDFVLDDTRFRERFSLPPQESLAPRIVGWLHAGGAL